MARVNQKIFKKYEKVFKGLQAYVVGRDPAIEQLFTQLTGVPSVVVTNPIYVVENLPPPDILVFTGGSDVSPVLYGEKNTNSNNDINRDVNELLFFRLYENDNSVLKVGICRGGQFLNVCNGGGMIQHLAGKKGHAGEHHVSTLMWHLNDVLEPVVNSTHHQGMVLGGDGTALLTHNGCYESILYHPKHKNYAASLCFQPHPEYNHETTTSIFMIMLGETINYLKATLRLKNVLPRVAVPAVLFDDLENEEDIDARFEDEPNVEEEVA